MEWGIRPINMAAGSLIVAGMLGTDLATGAISNRPVAFDPLIRQLSHTPRNVGLSMSLARTIVMAELVASVVETRQAQDHASD